MSAPDVCLFLANWWGGTWESYVSLAGISQAANVILGNNPAYGIADFLAVYPKFGTISSGLDTQRYQPIAPPDGTRTIFQFGGQASSADAIQVFRNGQLQTEGVDYTLILSGGVTTVTMLAVPALPVTDNLTVFFPTDAGVYVGVIPQFVLQMYINLANASLQFARWQDSWLMGMALFVAHYATLYLRSEGGFTASSPIQQIAQSGLAVGLAVSKSAGDVSLTKEYMTQGWESWGSWNLTTYGQQLITIGNIIGMGGMYIY